MSSGLFRDLVKFDDMLDKCQIDKNFYQREVLKERIADEYRKKHNCPDTDTADCIEFLYKEYAKGIDRHRFSKGR